jgi:hypothetical protein
MRKVKMKRKALIIVALIAVLLGTVSTPMVGYAQELQGNPPPSVPGVPTSPLSPDQIKAMPASSMDISSLNEQIKTNLDENSAGRPTENEVNLDAASASKIAAGKALKESLSAEGRTALAQVFAKYQDPLKELLTQAPAETSLTLQEATANAQKLDASLRELNNAFYADVQKILTPAEMELFNASLIEMPSLKVRTSDGVDTQRSVSLSSCTYCYYSYYYNYYASYYAYYGYYYAYYGYIYDSSSYSYSYYAYYYAYYAYYDLYDAYQYAYYTYYYQDFIDAAYAYYYSYYGYKEAYNAYYYAYYAYYYGSSTYSYLYYSYYYNYYTYYDGYYGNLYSNYTLQEFLK